MEAVSGPPGVVAFCAPGNEMLAAVACSLYGMAIGQVHADPHLSGDDLIVADLEKLGILRAASGPAARWWLRLAMARAREDEDRAEWIESVKQRLGLVTMGDKRASDDRIEWPAGIPDGQWEVVSDHVLELPAGWPRGCRCVLADGKRVSLGGPCPAHEDVSVATDGQ
jgi:hypothetical protein